VGSRDGQPEEPDDRAVGELAPRAPAQRDTDGEQPTRRGDLGGHAGEQQPAGLLAEGTELIADLDIAGGRGSHEGAAQDDDAGEQSNP
jgi:hypothetical protein